MKKLKRYIRMDEHLYEMANLTKEDTGLKNCLDFSQNRKRKTLGKN
ncbi:MAG TPA: hypothetical protein PLU55_04600 [Candidatus Pacearchaeota archaeon]|nr:hypothetical protein [Candidatus Pacearchaeota archaeon]